MTEPTLSFFSRVALAFKTWFRILSSGSDAERILQLDAQPTAPALLAASEPDQPARDLRAALQLLSALQREGRLIDFVQQDILTFSDSDVGAAARVVHDGCRRVLQRIVQFNPIVDEPEGHSVTVPSGYDAISLQLIGNVSGAPPFRGTLRHRGWRASGLTLPEIIGDTDCTVITPAEVEL